MGVLPSTGLLEEGRARLMQEVATRSLRRQGDGLPPKPKSKREVMAPVMRSERFDREARAAHERMRNRTPAQKREDAARQARAVASAFDESTYFAGRTSKKASKKVSKKASKKADTGMVYPVIVDGKEVGTFPTRAAAAAAAKRLNAARKGRK